MNPACRWALAGGLIMAGIIIELVAWGVVSVDKERVHAPMWVIGLTGLLFLAGGVLLAKPGGRIGTWAGGVVVSVITVVSGWVALYGPAEHFSGDLPWIAGETNVLIARLVFACVALLGLAILVGAVARLGR